MAPPNGSRSLQDGSKIVLDRFYFLLIFRLDFGSFWGRFGCRFGLPNGAPGVTPNWGYPPIWGFQDGLGIVLVRLFFRLAVWVRFFGCLGLLLESFWSTPGAVLSLLGLS